MAAGSYYTHPIRCLYHLIDKLSNLFDNCTFSIDINECLYINCTGNATCHNEPGRYRCICNRGYKGDGAKYCERQYI